MQYDPTIYEGCKIIPSEDLLEDMAIRNAGTVVQAEPESESDAMSKSETEEARLHNNHYEDIEDSLAGGGLGADEGEDVDVDIDDPGLYGYAVD
jgi:hypothetical protein